MYAPVPAAETEEKRARRLARNRESARQSRRRKKERLATLENQVTNLFAQMEQQRHAKIMVMEGELQKRRYEGLATVQSKEELQQLLHDTGPNCVVRERVASFQYEKLRQLLLPRHQEFLLWLTLQNDAFFSTAKNSKTGTSSVNNKAGRVSSKQIGEELMTEAKKSGKQNIEEDEDKVSSEANDVERMWPLLCFELLVSVDQEERLVQTQRRYVAGLKAIISLQSQKVLKLFLNLVACFLDHVKCLACQTSACKWLWRPEWPLTFEKESSFKPMLHL